MKLLFLTIVILTILGLELTPVRDDVNDQLYHDYVVRHGRNLKVVKEFERRQIIYTENVRKIKEHNS
jgi:C1A family cysteine protease